MKNFGIVLRYLTILAMQLHLIYSAPISRCMVDMSYVFDETTLEIPFLRKYEMQLKFNGTYENRFWLQVEDFSTGSHIGTHIDAPAHLSRGGASVDQIPLDRLIAPAAVIDITDRVRVDHDAEATVDDLLAWEASTGQSLNGTVVLLRTGWGRFWADRIVYIGSPDINMTSFHFPGLSPEAAQWLVDHRRIVGTGTDTLSIDRGQSTEYMSHRILLAAGLYGIESVANLERIPIYGATLYILPMKLGQASGAPTRVLASYPKVIFDGTYKCL